MGFRVDSYSRLAVINVLEFGYCMQRIRLMLVWLIYKPNLRLTVWSQKDNARRKLQFLKNSFKIFRSLNYLHVLKKVDCIFSIIRIQ